MTTVTDLVRAGDRLVVRVHDHDAFEAYDAPYVVHDEWYGLGHVDAPTDAFDRYPTLRAALVALSEQRPESARELAADPDRLAYALKVAYRIGLPITRDVFWDDVVVDDLRARDFPVPTCDGDELVFFTWSAPAIVRRRCYSLRTFDWVEP